MSKQTTYSEYVVEIFEKFGIRIEIRETMW